MANWPDHPTYRGTPIISASELPTHIESVLECASARHDRVIADQTGVPRAALISIEDYEKLVDLWVLARREEDATRLAALETYLAEHPEADLPDETVEEYVVLVVREGRAERNPLARPLFDTDPNSARWFSQPREPDRR
ncbi:MAG: hypothetical protein QM753_17685 [Thermomicrobiales bacterium]